MILFSLLVWIPASCLVHRIDRERRLSAEDRLEPSIDGGLSGKNRIEVARGLANSSFSYSPNATAPAHL